MSKSCLTAGTDMNLSISSRHRQMRFRDTFCSDEMLCNSSAYNQGLIPSRDSECGAILQRA